MEEIILREISDKQRKISHDTFAEEHNTLKKLALYIEKSGYNHTKIAKKAKEYICNFRDAGNGSGIESFFSEYGLNTQEGISIMCLAEALLRIPDSDTANELIHDKLIDTKWQNHIGKSDSKLVNASTIGLQLAEKILSSGDVVSSLADPFVREFIKQAMRHVGSQFVIGENIKSALKRGDGYQSKGYLLSYDMLGEGARSEKQAKTFMESYLNAIEAIKTKANPDLPLYNRPGISVKLSALYPKYELNHINDVLTNLIPRLFVIVENAKKAGICVTVDAEEARRLDLSLEVFKQIAQDVNYDGLGLAIQAYQKRAPKVIEFISDLAKAHNIKIPVRLVKGAYWDSEIKYAQIMGTSDYPVYTRKHHTDISYLACAYKILEHGDYIYPQFATHNALTIATIENIFADHDFEFQLLHGMGMGIYEQIVSKHKCRIYAPVGRYTELLPYLIRRLLENAANSSFINKIADKDIPVKELLNNPLQMAKDNNYQPADNIALPKDIYRPSRINSKGFDLGNIETIERINDELSILKEKTYCSFPIICGKDIKNSTQDVFAPYDHSMNIGKTARASEENLGMALESADKAFRKWDQTDVKIRAAILDKAANLLEEDFFKAVSICIKEGGKTIADAIGEVREAVDFLRYYALSANEMIGAETNLKGPTGEENKLSLHGRGVFLCISPWNFPLAIFTGQIAAALVSGNSVLAKPSEQTPLIAYFMVKLLHNAGIPKDVLHLITGSGKEIGAILLPDSRIAGVAFTGSNETANTINMALAQRKGAIVPFIAETGGQNAMIVDSSALPEQAIDDILTSAFSSAGQRCSALRVLYVQKEIADELIDILSGAMEELKIGNPEKFRTDIGPVIDKNALASLEKHIKKMSNNFKLIAKTPYDNKKGIFLAPHAFEINSISDLEGEVFGPVLHIIRYKISDLDKVIDEINSTGFGLTFGVHSRIEGRIKYLRSRIRAGNFYANRSMIGATVGVQPFGGEGLSGTGLKAGGPNYLLRFTTERVFTLNTTAIGGNRELLA